MVIATAFTISITFGAVPLPVQSQSAERAVHAVGNRCSSRSWHTTTPASPLTAPACMSTIGLLACSILVSAFCGTLGFPVRRIPTRAHGATIVRRSVACIPSSR